MKEFLFNQIKEMGFNYLRISLTKDCNGACAFCHNEGQKKGLRGSRAVPLVTDLTLKDYEYIADFFRPCLRSVSFTGGEPTLARNLPEIVHIFKSRDYQTKMTTNGFLLTNDLQQRLKVAGLDAINVSLSTLNPVQHGAMFNVANQFSAVMKNLENLSHNFKGQAKINFMALENVTVPGQLLPLSELSAKLGITISFLTILENGADLSDFVLTYLQDHIGQVWEEEVPAKFGTKRICYFENGAVWEFDDFRKEEYKQVAFHNKICQSCPLKEKCVEGPYALRISSNGDLRPCLIRTDNIILFQENGYANDRGELLNAVV